MIASSDSVTSGVDVPMKPTSPIDALSDCSINAARFAQSREIILRNFRLAYSLGPGGRFCSRNRVISSNRCRRVPSPSLMLWVRLG